MGDDGYDDEYDCPGYPEHDYVVFDEDEEETVYHCRRCGAELCEIKEIAT